MVWKKQRCSNIDLAAPKGKKVAWEAWQSLSSFSKLHVIVPKTAMAKHGANQPLELLYEDSDCWIFGGFTNSQTLPSALTPIKRMWFRMQRMPCNWIQLDSIGFYTSTFQYSIWVLILTMGINWQGAAKHSDLRRRSRWARPCSFCGSQVPQVPGSLEVRLNTGEDKRCCCLCCLLGVLEH